MKYLLVLQPLNKMKEDFFMPMGLPYINGAMRSKGFDVETINLQYAEGDMIDTLKETIDRKKIDVVMAGGLTTQYDLLKEIFEAAKAVNPEIITVGGGGGFSSEPILFSEMTGVDYAVIGEGEVTNCELAYALDHGDDVENILGLVIKKENGYIYTGEREYIKDMDSIPFPSYEGLEMERYLDEQTVDGNYYVFPFISDNPRVMPMLFARSCPFNCAFCYHPIGKGYRTRTLDNFFEELDMWIEKYQINGIVLMDECFSINPERVVEFCKRIKPYKLFWGCQMRVETYSEDLIRIMIDAGCISAGFGVESMSQKILDDMNKKTTVQQVQNALEVSYRSGAGASGNILFGAAAETIETVRESIEWCENNAHIPMNNFFMVGVYPGSQYYLDAVKKGIISDKKEFIEKGCPTINITSMSEKQYQLLAAYTRFKDREVRCKGKIISLEEKEDGINAVLECIHCGSRNTYKRISKSKYQKGIVRMLGCKKCHNYNTYVFDEELYKEKWNTTEWLFDYFVGKKSEKLKIYMNRKRYRNIAIYGVGLQVKTMVEILLEELQEINVNVVYGIDRQYDKFQDFPVPVYSPEDELIEVDAILVVPVYFFHDILCSLKKKTDMDIVSLEEVFE